MKREMGLWPEWLRQAALWLAFSMAASLAPVWAAHALEKGEGKASAVPDPPEAQLSLMEGFYREGDSFRAETEVLRFLHMYPNHPDVDQVEILRAKLYYRGERFADSSLMLFSHIDRFPRSRTTREAAQLLTFSLTMEGRLEDAEAFLGAFRVRGKPLPSLQSLKVPPENSVDPETALAWSTWLPGSGFFTLGQPGKAVAGLGLNIFFTAATVIAFEEDLPLAGLVFLIAELAIYRGGRDAVRDEAERLLAEQEREGWRAWARARGERKILAVGLRYRFGGG